MYDFHRLSTQPGQGNLFPRQDVVGGVGWAGRSDRRLRPPACLPPPVFEQGGSEVESGAAKSL